jgi:hypothetical protein
MGIGVLLVLSGGPLVVFVQQLEQHVVVVAV